jgi:hypothetical protein
MYPEDTTSSSSALPLGLKAFGERTPEIVGLLMACQLEASAPWVWVRTDGLVPDDAVALTLHVQGCYVEPSGQPRLWFMSAPIDDAEITKQWRGWQLGWFGCAGRIVLHADDGPHTFTAPDPPGNDLPRLSLWNANGQGVSFVPRRMYATYGPAPRVAAERHWWPWLEGTAAYLRVTEQHPSQQDYARAWTGLDLLVLLPGLSHGAPGRPPGATRHPSPAALRAAIDAATLTVWGRVRPRRPLQKEVAVIVLPPRKILPETERAAATMLSRRMRDELGLRWKEYIAAFPFPN